MCACRENARDLVQRLFAEATTILEQAHDVSVAGQAPALLPHQHLELAGRLRNHLNKVDAIAAAIATVEAKDKGDK